MRLLVLATWLLILGVPNGRATDNSGFYNALGNRPCGKFVEQRRANDVSQHVTGAWIVGYLTAYNKYTPDTYDIMASTDYDSVLLWVENYCRSNPLSSVDRAMEDLVDELRPRRAKRPPK